jgi:SAM-dependent methyltransferase
VPGGHAARLDDPPPAPQPPAAGWKDELVSAESSGPSPSAQRLGRLINDLVVRAPILWPLLRGPTRRFFDRRAPGWDERTGAHSAEHLTALAAALMRIEPPPERALDLGTGTGTGALLIAREFPAASVRGVDLSEEMIRLARKRVGLDPEGRIAFRVADAANLPYEDESFDLVAQLNMPPFFAETSRVLRPSGQLIVATSGGPRVPFYTPVSALERGFRRHGVELEESGEAGEGTYAILRARA